MKCKLAIQRLLSNSVMELSIYLTSLVTSALMCRDKWFRKEYCRASSVVCMFLKLVPLLPVATLNVQRELSSINFVKNKLRNSMGDQYLNGFNWEEIVSDIVWITWLFGFYLSFVFMELQIFSMGQLFGLSCTPNMKILRTPICSIVTCIKAINFI